MDTADDSGLSLTWHLRLRFWACLPWRGLPESSVSGGVVVNDLVAIVVRSLPGDTPENIERMIAQATNGDATANVLHIKRVSA